ncbi:MAG: S41 family peptidase [Saprospiraceae bacterium]
MNRFLAILITVFSVFTLSAQKGVNLDFETASTKNSLSPAGWKTGRLVNTDIWTEGEEGKGKALLLQPPFTESGSGYAYQMIATNGKPLTRYKITARIRTEDIEGKNAYVYAYGKGTETYLSYVNTGALTGDGNWESVSMTFTADDRMDSIRLGCYLGGEGKAWFDDLSFEVQEPAKGKMSKEAKAYYKEFFAKISSDAIDREKIDWKSLKRVARQMAAGAQAPSGLHEAMQYTLQRMNKHSFMFTPEAAFSFMGEGEENDEIKPDLVYTSGRRINDQVAYLSMPGMGSGHVPTMNVFADSIHALIAGLDNEQTSGWILDLRENGGGNCWPMLAGIGPLLGEGVCGYFMDRDGGNAQSWAYRNGTSYESDLARTSVKQAYELKGKNVRIAVLTGSGTASSGEVTAVAFLGKPNTRHFGQPSAGYATTNSSIRMSDGAMVLLTTSVYGDRNKVSANEQVIPDVIIEAVDGKDMALAAALRWLEEE